jgi:hypothetical protein
MAARGHFSASDKAWIALKQLNYFIMEKETAEHNMRLLGEKLRRTGFGEEVISAIREKVGQQKEQAFYIPYSVKTEGQKFDGYVYAYRLSENSPYQLGNFNIDLGKDSSRPLRDNIFYFTDGHEVSLREGYNLMQGRAVYREPLFDNDRRGYWVTLNDKSVVRGVAALNYERATKHVGEVVAESPVGRLLPAERAVGLAEALKQGERASVVVETMGLTKQVWVELDPVRESLKLTDRKGQLMSLPELRQERRLEAVVERRRGLRR